MEGSVPILLFIILICFGAFLFQAIMIIRLRRVKRDSKSVGQIQQRRIEELLARIDELKRSEGQVADPVKKPLEKDSRNDQSDELNNIKVKYQILFESSPCGILITENKTNKILFANPAACTFFQCTKSELESVQIRDLHSQEFSGPLLLKLTGDQDVNDIPEEFSWRKKDGDTIFAEFHTRSVSGSDTSYKVCFLKDVTEQRRIRGALEQALLRHTYISKMASLGEMTGGVAHEINNTLAIIMGKVEELRDFSKGNSEINQTLEAVGMSSVRIANIIKGLGVLQSNISGDLFQNISTREMIQNALALCQGKFKQSEVQVIEETKTEALIECHASEITQVLLNLLINAVDAVEGLPSKWIRIQTIDREVNFEFSVTDSGHGIPDKIKDKILEPFFSTKDVQKGTGLGLSISKEIIKKHSGFLKLDTSSSHTKFVISLPKRQNKVVAA
ncbi:MAG: Sensory box histidine kinase [Bacteriovoracaceae bacterium]|nr:Sensory box histidine kinase [Bacteriovoracaceae bacterium]